MIGGDGTILPHKLLLTNRQISNLRKAFVNHLSRESLSKTQLSKMIQSQGFLGTLLTPLLKIGLPLIENVIKPLAKSVLIPLGLAALASVADAGIHKKILGSGNMTTLIISYNKIEGIIKIVKSLEDSGLLVEGVTEIIQNKVKEQKGDLLCY